MESFVALLARAPHARPYPVQKPPVHDIRVQDTALTLIAGLEHAAMEPHELARALDMLVHYLPEIETFQTEKLEEGAKPNLHKGNTSRWIEMAGNPHVHPYSLFPIPKDLAKTDINNLLRVIVEVMTADNGTLVMYHYQQQSGLNPKQLTDILANSEIFWSGRPAHVAKLAFEFYRSNMLDHYETMKQMILKMNDPNSMMIFKDELRRTHSLLSFAFSQSPGKMAEYLSIEKFKNDLKLDQVQLIQFMALLHLEKLPFKLEFPADEFDFVLPRAGRICDMVRNRPDFSSVLTSALFSQYPSFDVEFIESELQSVVCFADDDEKREYAMIICSAVLWFDRDIHIVSAVLAHLVKSLKMEEFHVLDLIDLMYDNIDRIDSFRFLFGELQLLGVLTYARFWKCLTASGWFRSRREACSRIVCALPRLCKNGAVDIKRDLAHAFPELDLHNEIDSILENMSESIERAKQCPFLLRHLVSEVMIQKVDNLCDAFDILLELGTPNMIPDVLKRFSGARIPYSLIPLVNRMKPVFAVHDALTELDRVTSKVDTCTCVDHTSLISLVTAHSHLFSLRVFDALHGVRKPNEFTAVFHAFCADLLQFTEMENDLFYQFFNDFCESNCITGAPEFFVNEFISAVLEHPHGMSNKELLSGFLAKLFSGSVLTPEYVLAIVLSKETEQLEMVVDIMHVIFDVVRATTDNLTIHDILSERVVNALVEKFQTDTKLLSEFVNLLRILPSPIVTRHMVNVIEESGGSHYAAVLFSLLPEPLCSDDFSFAFNYFRENVDTETSILWTLWLKLRPLYTVCDGTFIIPVTPDDESLAKYRHSLVTAFFQLLGSTDLDPDDDRMQIYISCWNRLASDLFIAKVAVSCIAEDLRSSSITLSPVSARMIRPCLLTLDDKPLMDELCKIMCDYIPDDDNFCAFAVFATSAFAAYVSKFTWDASVVPMIASKILEWVPLLYHRYCPDFELVVDVFNFIIALTNTNQEPAFQETLHAAISDNLVRMPEELQSLIILNYPPQSFRPPTLPFSEYDVPPEPEPEPEPELEPQPEFHEPIDTGFGTNTHESTFDFDDMPDWMNVSFGL